MRRLRFFLGDVVFAMAEWLYPDEIRPDEADEDPMAESWRPRSDLTDIQPFFDLDDGHRLTPEEWAGLIVLHAEAKHGCEHTEQARVGIGMYGPRGKAAAS